MTALEPETPEPTGIDPAIHSAAIRENALLRAGVDLDTEQGRILADAWAAKDPDIDAMRRQWELMRPQAAPAEPTPDNPVLSEAEGAQAAERQSLAAGGHLEPNPADVDPMDESMRLAHEVLRPAEGARQRAGTHEDAMSTAFHHRAVAASGGDTRVLVQESPNQR